jgi:hypothetical protein
VFVSTYGFTLDGNISEISRAALYLDRQERITVMVTGAEPLYAELRLPNAYGWAVGQRVTVTIVPVDAETKLDNAIKQDTVRRTPPVRL